VTLPSTIMYMRETSSYMGTWEPSSEYCYVYKPLCSIRYTTEQGQCQTERVSSCSSFTEAQYTVEISLGLPLLGPHPLCNYSTERSSSSETGNRSDGQEISHFLRIRKWKLCCVSWIRSSVHQYLRIILILSSHLLLDLQITSLRLSDYIFDTGINFLPFHTTCPTHHTIFDVIN
jgi:hypothetical protein